MKIFFNKSKYLVILIVLLLLITGCGEQTTIVFDNSEGICSVIVYKDPRARDDDIVARVPAGKLSNARYWEPGVSYFYFKYGVSIKDYEDFLIYYISPDVDKNQKPVRIDENTENIIKVPDISSVVTSSTLLSEKSHIIIKNDSAFSFELIEGEPPSVKPDNFKEVIVNANETAYYTLNPGTVSNYKIRVGTTNHPFPSDITNLAAGSVYIYKYASGVSYEKTVQLVLANLRDQKPPDSKPSNPSDSGTNNTPKTVICAYCGYERQSTVAVCRVCGRTETL